MGQRSIEEYKASISTYIDALLTEKDEFVEKYGEKYRSIQNDEETMTRLATELYNNEVLNSYEDQLQFDYEEHYYINLLLDKETK